ncbi:hypothetical protein F3J02_15275, partial [Acinetobacter sp. Tr-809]|uniref:ESPR-type extended signal peptide-containing protein n=1 Tax=Acinetobacter sp. Tr-809 TaxID=2608324 RepID=UPI001EB70F34
MNKVYKVIWNASLGAWVAVSELAKGKTKNSGATVIGSVEIEQVSNTLEHSQFFNLKALSFAILTVVTPSYAFAGGYSAGGGNINAACNSQSTSTGQTGAIAIGGGSQAPCASQPYATAIGNNAQALSQGSIAIGSGAYANSSSNVDGTGAVAIGNDAVAIGKNSFALGAEASVTTDNTVSFGHAIGDDKYNNGTKTGTWTTDRFMRVANIANGFKNNDAVNVSQIKPLVDALGTTINATTGVVAVPSYTINKTDGNSYAAVNTVPAALANLNTEVLKSLGFAGDSGTKATRKLGQDLNIKGGATSLSTNNNIGVVSNGSDSLTLRLAKNIDLGSDGSVTTGNTTINNTGVTTPQVIIGSGANTTTLTSTGPSLSVGGDKITNVGTGDISSASSTDAVTGGQLFTTNQNVSNLTTTVTNQGNDITTLKGGFNLQTNGKNSGAIKAGDTVDIGVATPADTNLTATKTGNNVAFALSKDLNLTSVTTGNTVINNAGVTADKVTVGTVVVDKTTGINAGSKKITNVTAGAVNSTSTDAVNGSQLFNTANDVKNAIGGATTINASTGAITTSNIGGTGSNTIDGAITSVKSTADAAKTTADKGINFGGTTGKNNYALGSDINVKGDSNITSTTVAGGVQLGLANNITVGSGAGTNPVTINGTAGTVSGLTNKTWSGTATSGQAATEDQLKTVSDVANNANKGWKINTGATTGGTVSGNASTQVSPDQEVKFIAGKNVAITQSGKDITVATSDNPNFTSVTAGNSKLDNSGLVIKDATGGLNVSKDGVKFVDADGVTQTTNTPSLNKTGINAGNNKITNVANGAVTSGSKDAVNGGQLQGVADSVKTAIGGNTTIDATTGAISTSNIGGTGSNTIDGAITSVKSTADAAKTTADKGINFGGTTGKNNYALGSDINVKGDSNITSTTVAGGVQLGLANNITVGSGAGTNPVTINGTAGTVSGLTNKTWSGTATSGQAATEDQLKTVSDVANNANKGWKINTGATTGGTVSGNASTQVSPDQEVKFIAGKNVAITQSGKDITVATSDNPDFTSVTAGNSKLDNSGLVIKDATGGLNVSKDGVKFVDADGVTQTTNTPSLNKTGINAGNNKITNVANGAVTSGSKDAVNGGQLQGVADSVKTAIGGSTTIDATTGAITTNNIGGTGSNTIDGAITSVKDAATKAKTTVTAGDNVVVTPTTNADGSSNYQVSTAKDVNFDKVTVGTVVVDKTTGINAGNKKITNVTAGDISSAASTDAVNGGQLFTTNQNVTTAQNAADAAQATADKGIKFGNGTSSNQF